MTSAILGGYPASRILNYIARRNPHLADGIFAARVAGYSASQIMNRIADEPDTSEKYLTEHEKVQNRDNDQKRKALMQAIALAGTVGLIGGAAYGYATRNQAIRGQLLPALRNQQQLPSMQQLSGPPQQRGLPFIQGGVGQPSPSSPSPQMPPNSIQSQEGMPSEEAQNVRTPVPMRDPMKNIDLVKNLREDTRLENIIQNNEFDPLTSSLVLRSIMPKNKISLFDKTEGGLEQVVKDYSEYLSEQKKQQMMHPTEQPLTSPETMMQENKPMPPPQQAQAPQEPEIVSRVPEQQIQPKIERFMPEPETQGNLALLPKGQIGEIESVKNGVAKINVAGSIQNKKLSEIQPEPEGIERAVRDIVNSIPEGMKSTALQSMVHVPLEGLNLLLTQFYDGKWAWYLDVPEDIYKSIALGTYEPKGEAKTGIGEYKPGVADSRGAGFHEQIKINPKYSKANKGKTWGYATNEYALFHNIQNVIDKISKERYDEFGQIKVAKKRKKSTIE